ncbi:MAG: cobalamin-dependent protein [Spirochaetes bacterium]|nr:cobalamin-dependent protein [Spirochaetota bacterium]MBU1080247.1 cobalamin-dependent protein [Spirochaetota bacterium]
MRTSTAESDTVRLLYRYIIEAKRYDARRLLRDEVERSGYDETLQGVLEPTLSMIGERWAVDCISLAQGFVAGKVAEDFLDIREKPASGSARDASVRSDASQAYDASQASGIPRRIAVLGNVEDDFHSLGRSLVVSFLRLEGWTVVDLGNDVPAGAFADAAADSGASVIGASAMMLATARRAYDIRQELVRKGLSDSVMLALGGAAFSMKPELAGELGGDGTARNALEAPALFERLRLRSGRLATGPSR